jgi:hypothetical protein
MGIEKVLKKLSFLLLICRSLMNVHGKLRQLRTQMTTMDGGNAVFAGAKNCPMYSVFGIRLWLPASLYLLHPCSRPCGASSLSQKNPNF